MKSRGSDMLIASIDVQDGRTLISVRWAGQGEGPTFAAHAEAVAAVTRALVSAHSGKAPPQANVVNPPRSHAPMLTVVGGVDARPSQVAPSRMLEAARLLTKAATTNDSDEQQMMVATAMLVLNSADVGKARA